MTSDPEHTKDTSNVESVEDEGDNNPDQPVRRSNSNGSGMEMISLAEIVKLLNKKSPSPSVKRRIDALKKLQLGTTEIEAQFYKKVHELECTYYNKCADLYSKRRDIIAGLVEPTDEECQWENDVTNDEKRTPTTDSTDKNESEEKDDTKGIPDFWLTIFKNVGMLADMVEEHDEPILKHLSDIQVKFLKSDPMGFILEFYFDKNEYFSNSVLTKEYIMKCTPDKDDPFSFEGPEIYKSTGCTINWKKGKNVTQKTIHKKHKSRENMPPKFVQNDSFFNFFSPPDVSENDTLDDDLQALLTSDFEIGHYIRERIVPRAVLYYTGEQLEEEEDDYEEEEEEDEDDVDEEEDEEVSSTTAKSDQA